MESSPEAATMAETGERLPADVDELAGLAQSRLGRYLLVEPIGKGAFGLVWAAYDPELDRKVAIKLLRVHHYAEGSSVSDGTRGRSDELIAEAQLPAQLSHPNVVAIHDVGWVDADDSSAFAGSADERALYVVMEHLSGGTLRGWLDEEKSEGPHDWREVVRVLVQAGRGLEAAHQRKLVHLDFKPGNVMFGENGRPRVLDFGLARVLRRERDPSASGTLPVAGTPAYMAPEQHTGQNTDERTDQYAFGVTLWEALWGAWPFMAGSSRWLQELTELKLAGPPQPPRKPSVPAHVRAVVLRALAPRPEDRFADMSSLLAALEDNPAARRRRGLVIGLGLAAIIGMGYAALTREDPCALPEDRLAGVWDERVAAELDQAWAASGVDIAADAMARVRAGLDDQIGRWTEVRAQVCEAGRAGGHPVEVMSEEFLCLEAHLGHIAALTTSLRAADSQTIARAADSVVHLPAPEDCRSARRGQAKRELDDDARAALLAVEAVIARSEAETSLGRFEAAIASAAEALTVAEALADRDLLGQARLARGRALEKLARFDESHVELLAALEDAEAAGDDGTVVEILLVMIHAQIEAGHYDQAELLGSLADARLANTRVDDPRLPIELDLHLSQIALRRHRWDEALTHGQRGLDRQRELDPSDRARLADFHLAIGNVHVGSQRDLDGGQEHYELAQAIWLEIYGPGHPMVATVLINLSAIDFRREDHDSARERLLTASEMFAYTLPPEHPRFGMIHQNLAALFMVGGRYPEAIEHSERALEVFRGSVGADATQYALAQSNLTAVMLYEGRYTEALAHAHHVVTVYEAELGPEDGRRVAGLNMTIEALWGLGRDAEASERVTEILALQAGVDADDPRQSEALYVRAEAQRRAGQLEDALATCEQLLTHLGVALSEPEPVADVGVMLGQTLRALGRAEQARERLGPLLERLGGTDEDAHIASWALRLELGRVERELGDQDAAREHLEAAMALRGDYERAPVLAAEVDLALAEFERERDPESARARAQRAAAALDKSGARPDLLAQSRLLLGE